MLSRPYRLHLRKDFEHLYESGKSLRFFLFFVRFFPNQQSVSRFAFVVSNRIAKRANVRNRMKRQMRAIVGELLPQTRGTYDVLFNARRGWKPDEFEELKRSLTEALKKITLLK